jgi:hypothetical protein
MQRPRLATSFVRFLLPAFSALGLQSSAGAWQASDHIRVDAFGYEAFEAKVAVLRQAVVGFDAPDSFTPGASIQLVRDSDGAVLFARPPVQWTGSGGAVHATSGDRAWWFDFSQFTAPGTYRVVDAASGESSEAFEIKEDALAAPRRAALRMFFYQRVGFAKTPPFADPRWADGASHNGPLQDLDCRDVLNPSGPGLDLSGGWYDAGDFNKYTNFTDGVIQDLLSAYQVNPEAWDDAAGIPESGNGIPDLLDETRWGLEWMLRMQRPSGGLLHKVSVADFAAASPPSADTAQRFYGGVTASATASGAAAFARAAYVYRGLSDASSQAFANQLETAAVDAWNWLALNPAFSSYANVGFQNVAAEDPPHDQGLLRVNAAIWLAALTNWSTYHNYVAANYNAYPELSLTSGWLSPYQNIYNEALLRYAELPTANPSVRDDVRQRFLGVMKNYWLAAVEEERDPYRAWLGAGDHVWGSNRTVAAQGALHAEAALLDPCDAAWHEEAARGYAHFFHGVNARGLTYLSNMADDGAENSIQEIYHAWFSDGTIWDRATATDPGPAPGFVAGGPNQFYAPDPAYSGAPIVPPMNQPPAKSYRDWNPGWPEASWSVTEPSTGYQSAYLVLMAHVAPGSSLGAAQDGSFCPGAPNSSGERAHIRAIGSTSLAANGLTLGLSCAPGPTFGLFFYGPSTQLLPAGNGSVCIAAPRRLAPSVPISPGGNASLALDLGAPPFSSGPSSVAAGETWFFQTWHRDSIGAGFGTSDAMRVTFQP